jgi:acetylornithine/succinyldiaminopimelate/putrescine aminotransferase
MIVTGKGQGNGFPISAVLANGRCAEVLRGYSDEFSSTHGGNPVACAAGLAVIEVFEPEEIVHDTYRNSDLLQGRLTSSCQFPSEGKGMVAAILTPSADVATEIVLKCREKGLLVVHTGKASVKIGPPLTISSEDLEKGLEILMEVACG